MLKCVPLILQILSQGVAVGVFYTKSQAINADNCRIQQNGIQSIPEVACGGIDRHTAIDIVECVLG
ncbi:hypothetical protein EHS13_04600 [Paenibacillus psychroresistens]|uniref:Uncharacterized protein n=1 Tax=Paenibacillus psychroresistens TaxID=1778678 RepID=A0A6B8RFU4_9BACL|nr:hypothetical protein EHS13_04600 [Paenibacillus psychroresistens]